MRWTLPDDVGSNGVPPLPVIARPQASDAASDPRWLTIRSARMGARADVIAARGLAAAFLPAAASVKRPRRSPRPSAKLALRWFSAGTSSIRVASVSPAAA